MRGLSFLFSLIIIFVTFNCSLIRTDKDLHPVLFEIDSIPVYSDEFLYNFSKNMHPDSSVNREEIDEYLDLYINFKLKVADAVALGYDTTASFKKEFTKYKEQLTESYLKDDSIIENLVIQAYERMQKEVDVSHILVRVEDFFDFDDTLDAFREVSNIYELLRSGSDFEQMALDYSEDPSVGNNRGHLGYFTALQMVYPFENVAYNTSEGDISAPFKTRFGYHILKVNDVRPARGRIQVAHIMLRLSEKMTENDSLKVKQKIDMIYDSLREGSDWDDLCRVYSEDPNTNNRGGVLQPFQTGRVIPVFSDAAFSLQAPGEISKPVLTPYGWHIIRLIARYPIPPFDEIRGDLTDRVKRDSRSALSHTMLINRLKTENDFSLDEEVKQSCLMLADSTLLMGRWSYDSVGQNPDALLFSINDQFYAKGDFLNYVMERQMGNNQQSPAGYMNELLEEFIDQELIDYQKAHLEQKYPEYKMLVKEYREGILLFDLMEKEVWNRGVSDTLGLREFFADHRENYKWGERLDAMIFSSPSHDAIEGIRSTLSRPYYPWSFDTLSVEIFPAGISGNQNLSQLDSLYARAELDPDIRMLVLGNRQAQELLVEHFQARSWSLDELIYEDDSGDILKLMLVSSSKKSLEKAINENSALHLLVESGYYEKGDHEIIDMIDWSIGCHDLSIEETDYLVFVDRVIPVSSKELDDVRGRVISDYQDFLEDKLIEELKGKYSVHINNDALSEIYREYGIH